MDKVENLEKICQDIIKLDTMIRSAGIINNRGHLIAGGMKEGVQPLEDARRDEMMFMELSLRVRMRHEFDSELGEVHFSLSYRSKVIMMSFPLPEDYVLLVSAEKDFDFAKTPFKILDLITVLKEKK